MVRSPLRVQRTPLAITLLALVACNATEDPSRGEQEAARVAESTAQFAPPYGTPKDLKNVVYDAAPWMASPDPSDNVATGVETSSLEDQVRTSSAVVLARCVNAVVEYDQESGRAFTNYVFKPARVLSGRVDVDQISSRVLGGVIPDKVITVAPEAAKYNIGEDYLLFLIGDGEAQRLGMGQECAATIEAGGVRHLGKLHNIDVVRQILPNY